MKERIIEIRKEKKYSQEKFANELGLSRNFINQVENGKKNLSERSITDICEKFGVNREWLVDGTGEMKKKPDDTLGDYLGKIAGGDDEVIKAFIESYMETDEISREALKDLLYRFADKLRNRG